MNKINLKNVDMICIDCVHLQEAIDSLELNKSYCDFNSVKLLTSLETDYEHAIKIPKISSIEEYSDFIFQHLADYIEAEYVLIVQWDGYIKNPDAWTDEFLQYDYIGAVIPVLEMVGNGGFCIRSKKLMDAVCKMYNKSMLGSNPLVEDVIISYHFRPFLERMGFRFAPKELANRFSVEPMMEWTDSFGAHGFKYNEDRSIKQNWFTKLI